ncbi:tyrosine-protein phosphatase [Parapedobacter deserti]|uniref:protein-tyrosine-phosphatase n=1 Tax=Parapedobacter deserti TaxID=1912957 RepID=A0ABV7JLM5_9SPHI
MDWLGLDVHSHLLPGIDDGSPSIETSLGYINRLESLGLRYFYATPHVHTELYPNTAETIQRAFEGLREVLPDRITLRFAAEYMVDEAFDARFGKGKKLLTLPHNHVLIEMSYMSESLHIDRVIFELQAHGYTPILAHPERYVFYYDRLNRYQQLKHLGCLMQMNLLSPTGYYSQQVKKTAQHLLKRGMIDFVGTDLHHQKHLAAIEQFVLSGDAHSIFRKNPIKNLALIGV